MNARRITAMILVALFFAPATVWAQKNPFADDEEEAEESAPVDEARLQTSAAVTTAGVESEQEAAEQAEAQAAAEEAAAEKSEDEEEEEEVPHSRRGRVGLTNTFSTVELISTAAILPVGLGLAIGGPALFGEPDASMTTPRLGSIDYRLSVASHGDLLDGNAFAGGLFDITGYALPSAIGAFYFVSGLYLWSVNRPMLGAQSINIDHSMLAAAQAAGWTAFAAGLAHILVGREKPYVAFDRTAYGSPDDNGANLSFISTTTALSFAMSSFAARDFAGWARREGVHWLVGGLLPHIVLYGASSMVGFSRIYGQQHYFSDIAVSAALGALIGNMAWVAHFDADGRPRMRTVARALAPTVIRDGRGHARVGLGLTGRW